MLRTSHPAPGRRGLLKLPGIEDPPTVDLSVKRLGDGLYLPSQFRKPAAQTQAVLPRCFAVMTGDTALATPPKESLVEVDGIAAAPCQSDYLVPEDAERRPDFCQPAGNRLPVDICLFVPVRAG